jgi:hypothetical protein
MIAGLTIILVAFGLLVGFASMDQDTKLRMPVWLTFAAVVVPLIMVAVGGTVSALFTARATSVLIYSTGENCLYYEFWSPKYQEYLKKVAYEQEKIETSSPKTGQ